MRAFEILGEAAEKIPLPVRKRHAKVPWKQMAGMRDKLTHEYFGVNYEVLWRTVQAEIPRLRSHIAKLLASEQQNAHRHRG